MEFHDNDYLRNKRINNTTNNLKHDELNLSFAKVNYEVKKRRERNGRYHPIQRKKKKCKEKNNNELSESLLLLL